MSEVGGTSESNCHHGDVPIVDGFILPDKYWRGIDAFSVNSSTPLTRRVPRQLGGTRVMDCNIGTSRPCRVPNMAYHYDNICNPRKFLRHVRLNIFVDNTGIVLMTPTKETPAYFTSVL